MILSGRSIEHQIREGRIRIDPFEPSHLNPASIDLRLGDSVRIFPFGLLRGRDVIDCKTPCRTIEMKIGPDGLVIYPRELCLMHTLERVWTDSYVPVLDGKSSIGRLGVQVHMTAGYGDPGFDGQYTLEVTSVYPVRVYPGMRFCQMRFHQWCGEGSELYRGNYNGETSMGPIPSMVHRQFKGE
jgi:dCTP deaminase